MAEDSQATPKTWLHCMDASSASLNGFKHLVHTWVRADRGDSIILFTVQTEEQSEAENATVQKFVRLLATVQDSLQLNKPGGVSYKITVATGSADKKKIGKQIIEEALQSNVSYIVIGCRTNTLQKKVLGSVSEYVLHHSDVPVIIVPEL